MLRVTGLKVPLEENSDIKKLTASFLGIKETDFTYFKVFKRVVDARNKNSIRLKYVSHIEVGPDVFTSKQIKKNPNLHKITINSTPLPKKLRKPPKTRPVVVGMGPAGLFAAYTLAKYGAPPLIVERGKKVEERSVDVNRYWNSGQLNENSNVQFGEGGAGTFSDGKLTTRINNPRLDALLELMISLGAPHEIIEGKRAHVGTDNLFIMMQSFRKLLISMGVKIRFNSKISDFLIQNGHIKGVLVNQELISSNRVIVATGNGARDTYSSLFERGVELEPKPFGMGLRIEHPRKLIDELRYGKYAGHPKLGTADYSLIYNNKQSDRSTYSFCMCPGGDVIASSSEVDGIVTNGMSNFARNGEKSNSALAVTVFPKDFENPNHPLSGLSFQRKWEQNAFKMAGGNGYAPAQMLTDFLGISSTNSITGASYRPGVIPVNLRDYLPSFITDEIKTGLHYFNETWIPGFISSSAILTGVETRTSSPVRIKRGENMQSTTVSGLFPCGEGSGYAGGIVASALDGIKAAEAIIKSLEE